MWTVQSDVFVLGVNRLDTRRSCGRRDPPGRGAWRTIWSVITPRASCWIKWQPPSGKGGTGMPMTHTWSTTTGSISNCNLLNHRVKSCFLCERCCNKVLYVTPCNMMLFFSMHFEFHWLSYSLLRGPAGANLHRTYCRVRPGNTP